jgi:hypothetical protein
MRKVLIGTPSHDGRLDVWYVNSLVNTIRIAPNFDTHITAVYTSFDSLVQRARNSLVTIAMEENYDDIFFIDSDVEWDPQWIFKFLQYPEDVVGAALVKKDDVNEGYTCKITNQNITYNSRRDLIEVDGIGTGFLKVSRNAFKQLYQSSAPYKHENKPGVDRMIFDVIIKDDILISEDYTMCNKWKALNDEHKIWMDPTITINHIGPKKYQGNIYNYLKVNKYKL